MAVLEALDQVISVDTSIVHLAGAMGKPAWVMLPYAPDWRWLLDRTDTPWYPSLRFYRQGPDRSWTPVIAAIADALRAQRPG
jgi:ADP-heptose:LPS heptosyltransferase